jgi:hypothetical protein
MDIRSRLDGLEGLLGVTAPPTPSMQSMPGSAATPGAGCEVAQTASDKDIRMDKVASIQAALASGTYDPPPGAVASKMMEAMLGSRVSTSVFDLAGGMNNAPSGTPGVLFEAGKRFCWNCNSFAAR